MADGYSVYYAILCDDIRTENNNKDILIGCYNDVVSIKSFPHIARFSLRISIYLERDTFEKVTVHVIDANGNLITGMEGDIENKRIGVQTIFNIGGLIFMAAEPSEYVVLFGFDGVLDEIYKFKLQFPETD